MKRDLTPPHPCGPGCKGWHVFDVDSGEPEIQACDEAWDGVKDAPTDDDYAKLPECKRAMKHARKVARAAGAISDAQTLLAAHVPATGRLRLDLARAIELLYATVNPSE